LSMAAIINKSTHPDILPSPRDKSVGNGHEDGASRYFQFKPHLNSSTQSMVWNNYKIDCFCFSLASFPELKNSR
jgi:hypothetical protein